MSQMSWNNTEPLVIQTPPYQNCAIIGNNSDSGGVCTLRRILLLVAFRRRTGTGRTAGLVDTNPTDEHTHQDDLPDIGTERHPAGQNLHHQPETHGAHEGQIRREQYAPDAAGADHDQRKHQI